MAILQKIRNKAGLLVVVIGVALLAFIIGDFLNSAQAFFRMSQDKVVVVNGEKVTTQEFSELVSRRTEEMQNMFRQQYGMAMPEGYSDRINKSVFDQIVEEMLIKDATEDLGIAVSPEELNDMLYGDHIAPQIAQQFGSKAELLNFLQVILSDDLSQYPENVVEQILNYRTSWNNMKNDIQKQRLAEKYLNLVVKTMVPNKYDLQASYDNTRRTVEFNYAMQPYTSVSNDDVTVSAEELKAAYNKNKETYKQNANRTIKYIAVDIVPSEADYKATEDKIDGLKSTFATTKDMSGFLTFNTDVPYSEAYVAISSMDDEMKNFVQKSKTDDVSEIFFEDESYKVYRLMGKRNAPDSVKVRHIMFPLQGDAALTARIDSIYNVLKKGGDFATLAAEYSYEQNSGKNGGDMGWVAETDAVEFGKEFTDHCFLTNNKSVVRIESPYGIHLVQVTDRKAPVAKANVAQMVMNVRPSSETYSNLYNKISSYIATNNQIDNFEANATAEGLMVNTATVGKDDINFGTINDGRSIVKWAFNAKPATLSEIFNVENRFLVAMVTNAVEEGYMSQASVEPFLRQQLLTEKKGEKMSADLKAKNYTNIDAAAQGMGGKVEEAKFVTFNTASIAGLGNESALIGAASVAEKGKLQGPVAGNRGVYMFTVTNQTNNTQPMDTKAETEKYNQKVYAMMNQFMSVLKDNADIEDNRIKFY
ncbi:MAG: SurA N-terminal domain-containing protein [Coprobacter sp.]|nr:SurA N-terminal domain-containing protein [Coprobacter sp.]